VTENTSRRCFLAGAPLLQDRCPTFATPFVRCGERPSSGLSRRWHLRSASARQGAIGSSKPPECRVASTGGCCSPAGQGDGSQSRSGNDSRPAAKREEGV